jgi:hypothetical protein
MVENGRQQPREQLLENARQPTQKTWATLSPANSIRVMRRTPFSTTV